MNKGFKQTEIGIIIPKDWITLKIGDILTFKHGKDRKTVSVADGEYPILATGGQIGTAKAPLYTKPSVLIGRKGTINKPQYMDTPFWVVDTLFYSAVKDRYHPKFLFYIFCLVDWLRHNEASGVPSLNAKTIESIEIQVPALGEQQAIANVLSDADAYIESLEKLIEKKRLIKKGAMQELLTGKRRLPGFSGEWITKRLSELSEIRSGGTPSTIQPDFWDGSIPWCTPTDITGLNNRKYLKATARTISEAGLRSSSAEWIPSNSVIMTSRATIGECAINTVPVTTNQGFKSFIPLPMVDTDFLYYLLLVQKKFFLGLCAGSTFLEIRKTQLAPYKIILPSMKGEQIAIAQILADMDLDIESSASKLTKARLIKQGMMQQLLTGKIRL